MYQTDRDANEFYMCMLFESKDAYHANAQDPRQDALYEEMRALLTEDPEWHDGEVRIAPS